MRRETTVVEAGRPPALPGGPLNTPIVPTSTYHHGGDLVYGRDGNEGWMALESALGALEGGIAVAFGSGLAASAAILNTFGEGGVVVAPGSAYHGVIDQLGRRSRAGRVTVRSVDPTVGGEIGEAARGADLVWIETPSNPMIDIADIGIAAAAAHAAGSLIVVDNTFATPILQRPFEHDADIVLHSATKFIGGHSDGLLGVVVVRTEEHAALLRAERHGEGAVPGALEAFLCLRGLRTLAVRVDRAQANARELAIRLEAHPLVSQVRYPGLASNSGHDLARRQMDGPGALLSYEPACSPEEAERICERTSLITHATSLGGVETLMERRARYASDRAAGVPETLIRLAVGIEHVEDLWSDLEQALAGIGT